ncbi:hypothetical protein CR513_33116, partial [Mucuna pruriens]
MSKLPLNSNLPTSESFGFNPILGIQLIESESSQGESKSSSEVQSSSDHSHYEGDLLMVRKLTSNMSGEETES